MPNDLSSLRGRRVLITGAARGLGAGLARRLAAEGARLALVGLEVEDLRAVGAACGAETFVAECDVTDAAAVQRTIDDAAAALGGLDVVVANAGIITGGPLRSQEVRSWERTIQVNLLGVMHTDRAALPHLERSRGYLLNVSSSAAALRGAGMTAYCASKAAVEAMSDCLRVEAALDGVAVGVAYFLFLDTDMVNEGQRDMALLHAARAGLPSFVSRSYALEGAVDAVAAAIAVRRRRVAHPRWFGPALALRQAFASPLAERLARRGVREALAEHERLVAERGEAGAAASERTRRLAGMDG